MGGAKDMWMDAIERIGEEFDAGLLSREEAIMALIRKGFDGDEATTMIDERAS